MNLITTISAVLALFLNFASIAYAQPTTHPARPPRSTSNEKAMTGDAAPIERDFILACAISRMGMSLQNATAFREQKVDLATRIASLAAAGLRTAAAKNTLKLASTVSGAQAKQKIWQDAARDAGLTKWTCPSIEIL